jgi:hypothetical protein
MNINIQKIKDDLRPFVLFMLGIFAGFLLGTDPKPKNEPQCVYECHSISYKETTAHFFQLCIENKTHRKERLQPIIDEYEGFILTNDVHHPNWNRIK